MRTFCLSVALALLGGVLSLGAEDSSWITLIGEEPTDVWKNKTEGWIRAGGAELDAKNLRALVAKPGKGVFVNAAKGRKVDLVTKEKFGDVELEMEFLIAKRSNSGVKFHALYEIQIYDSFGVKKLTGNDCGGVYPRAELKPKYHHIDEGVPPRTNACKPAGEWQKLHAVFLAPRFDAAGKKTANAKLVKATLNGALIHDNVELKTPTGHNYTKKESATGPLMLQGDHGPVAFRNVRIRPYK